MDQVTTDDIAYALDLPWGLAKVVELLLDVRSMPASVIEEHLNCGPNTARVYVYRLRPLLERHDITIKCAYRAGYSLSPEGKKRVMELVANISEPLRATG